MSRSLSSRRAVRRKWSCSLLTIAACKWSRSLVWSITPAGGAARGATCRSHVGLASPPPSLSSPFIPPARGRRDATCDTRGPATANCLLEFLVVVTTTQEFRRRATKWGISQDDTSEKREVTGGKFFGSGVQDGWETPWGYRLRWKKQKCTVGSNQRRTKVDFGPPVPGRVWKVGPGSKGRAGLPKRYCAGFYPPVFPYPPGFPIPAGYLITRRVDSEPSGLVRYPPPRRSCLKFETYCKALDLHHIMGIKAIYTTR